MMTAETLRKILMKERNTIKFVRITNMFYDESKTLLHAVSNSKRYYAEHIRQTVNDIINLRTKKIFSFASMKNEKPLNMTRYESDFYNEVKSALLKYREKTEEIIK